MARHVCWDPDLVRRFFTTEASTKASRDDFLRLHLPIERIRVLDAKPMIFPPDTVTDIDGVQFVSEEGLLTAIRSAHLMDPNRIFAVVGEPGAGKSHLARWIEYALEPSPIHLPIHVPRHVDTLEAVARHLERQTGISIPIEATGEILAAPPDKLVRYIVAAIEMEAGRGTVVGREDQGLAKLVEHPAFHAAIERQIARYQSERRQADTGLKTRAILELSVETFAEITAAVAPRTPTATLRRWHEMLVPLLRRVLRQMLHLDRFDIQQVLVDISRRAVASGKRPVLILEDVTSFDLLNDDLLTFLFDESAGHFDALVCWTTGFERAYMQTYQQQRYTARLSLTDNCNEAYSMREGRCIDLVRRYLDAARIDGTDGCPICTRSGDCFDGLYPFNTAFVRRIYENLIAADGSETRTPRHLLDRAIKGYLELAEYDGPFPPLKQPEAVKDVFYDPALYRYRDEYASFVALMTWYGEERDGTLTLPRAVARHLGVTVPDEWEEADLIIVPVGGHRRAPEAVRATDAELTRLNHFKALRLELQSWFHLETPLEHYLDLQRGVYKTLQFFHRRLPLAFVHPSAAAGVGKPVAYGRDAGETNIYVHGTRVQPSRAHQVEIGPRAPGYTEAQQYHVLESALALHVLGTFPEGTDFALLDDWSGRLHGTYQWNVDHDLAGVLGLDVPGLLLFAKFLLMNRYHGVATLDNPLMLLSPIVDESRDSWLPIAEYSSLARFATNLDDAIRALFFISRDFLDYPRLAAEACAINPIALVGRARMWEPASVGDEFRFSGGPRLRDLVRAVKGVCEVLHEVRLDTLRGDTMASIGEIASAARVKRGTLIGRVEAIRSRIGIYALHSIYDDALWRRWDAARAACASEAACGQEQCAPPPAWNGDSSSDALASVAWFYRIQEWLAHPENQLAHVAIAITRQIESRVESYAEPSLPGMRKVLRRRDALDEHLRNAGGAS